MASGVTATQTIGIVTGLCLAAPALSANPASTRVRTEGSDFEYNLRIDQALARYRQAVDADGADPAAYRAVASMYMLKIAFGRGAVTTDDFLSGDISSDTSRFRNHPLPSRMGSTPTPIKHCSWLKRKSATGRTMPTPATSWARQSR